MSESYPYLSCRSEGDDSIKIPAAVRKEAEHGLKMIKNGYHGGVATGHGRAKQLYECERISVHALYVMKNFYSRHMITSLSGYQQWVKDGKPIQLEQGYTNKRRGAIAILIWGGIAAFHWLRTKRVINLLNKFYPSGKNELKSLSYYQKATKK